MGPRVARPPAEEEPVLHLGRIALSPKGGAKAEERPSLRIAGQMRKSNEAALRAATAFDAQSQAWRPLTALGDGRFMAQGSIQTPRGEEAIPPPPGGTEAGPAPEPLVEIVPEEARELLEMLDQAIPKLAALDPETRASACPEATEPVLADARAFRARLASALARSQTAPVGVIHRDVHAAEIVTACAGRLSGGSAAKWAFAAVGVAVVTTIVLGLVG